MIQRAFERGALGDLTADDVYRLLKGISAHSTRVGLNQDLFASGEDLAGIMDALRWKSPRIPLAYNRNLAAEQGAAGRLMVTLCSPAAHLIALTLAPTDPVPTHERNKEVRGKRGQDKIKYDEQQT